MPGAFNLLTIDANDAGPSSQTYTGSDWEKPGTEVTEPSLSIRAAAADASRCAPLCAFCFTAVLERMYDPLLSIRHAGPKLCLKWHKSKTSTSQA